MLRHLEPTYAYQLDSTERPPSCHGALANLDGRGRGLTDDSLSSTTELGSFQQALVVSAACSSSSSLSERSNSHGDVGVVANPGTPPWPMAEEKKAKATREVITLQELKRRQMEVSEVVADDWPRQSDRDQLGRLMNEEEEDEDEGKEREAKKERRKKKKQKKKRSQTTKTFKEQARLLLSSSSSTIDWPPRFRAHTVKEGKHPKKEAKEKGTRKFRRKEQKAADEGKRSRTRYAIGFSLRNNNTSSPPPPPPLSEKREGNAASLLQSLDSCAFSSCDTVSTSSCVAEASSESVVITNGMKSGSGIHPTRLPFVFSYGTSSLSSSPISRSDDLLQSEHAPYICPSPLMDRYGDHPVGRDDSDSDREKNPETVTIRFFRRRSRSEKKKAKDRSPTQEISSPTKRRDQDKKSQRSRQHSKSPHRGQRSPDRIQSSSDDYESPEEKTDGSKTGTKSSSSASSSSRLAHSNESNIEEKHQAEVERLLAESHKRLAIHQDTINKQIKLNIGGEIFCTSTDTLRKYPHCTLSLHVLSLPPEQEKEYFVDRDPKHFRLILNFLRTGAMVWPESASDRKELMFECEFYNLLDDVSFIPRKDFYRHMNKMLVEGGPLECKQDYREISFRLEQFLLRIQLSPYFPDEAPTIYVHPMSEGNNEESRPKPIQLTFSHFLPVRTSKLEVLAEQVYAFILSQLGYIKRAEFAEDELYC